jgi:hypothetical protein
VLLPDENVLKVAVAIAQHFQAHGSHPFVKVLAVVDGGLFFVQHPVYRIFVRTKEVEAFEAEERCALQPALDEFEEAASRLNAFKEGLLVFGEDNFVRLAVVGHPVFLAQTEGRFDHPELHALETRSGKEVVPKVKKVERREGFHHVNLLHHQAHNRGDTLEAQQHGIHIVLVHLFLPEKHADGIQLGHNLLEPQLVHLVHNDEEGLIVRRFTQGGAAGVLDGQKLVDLQVIVVMDGRILLIGHGAKVQPGNRAFST